MGARCSTREKFSLYSGRTQDAEFQSQPTRRNLMPIVLQRRSKLALVVLSILSSLTLLAAVPMFADDSNGPSGAVAGVLFLFIAVFAIVLYVYFALAFQTIAKKTNTENAWWAWVPILNVVLMLNIAKKPIWWIILFFIPIVSLVMAIITLMAVAEARNKPSWWGILIIIPVIGLVVPGYLAWAD
jgi:hypothetical protein